MRLLCPSLTVLLVVGCDFHPGVPKADTSNQTLVEAKKGFRTKLVRDGDLPQPPSVPAGDVFEAIKYKSPVGDLIAYVTKDPGDGKKHPAIVWITGGDNNSIGPVWEPMDPSNDQTASAFRKAGIVMMFPSQRGGNANPGRREGFLGEVDDVLAATDHLMTLPYVDPKRVYLGGHSTGGTLVMLVGACTDRYQAVFSFGPVASPAQYGTDFIYCDTNDEKEVVLRSPIAWMHCVTSPMYVFEGEMMGNWDAVELMQRRNSNPHVQFFKVPDHDHFTVIDPVIRKLAQQIVAGQVHVTPNFIQNL